MSRINVSFLLFIVRTLWYVHLFNNFCLFCKYYFFLYFVSFDSFIQALPNSPNTYTFHTSGDIAFHACLSLIIKAFCSIDLSVESLVLLPFLFPTPTLVLHEKINRTGLNYMDNSDRYTSLLGFSEF